MQRANRKNGMDIHKQDFQKVSSELLRSYKTQSSRTDEEHKVETWEKIETRMDAADKSRSLRKRFLFSVSSVAAVACILLGIFWIGRLSVTEDNRLIAYVSDNSPAEEVKEVRLFKNENVLDISESQIEYDEKGKLNHKELETPDESQQATKENITENTESEPTFDQLIVPKGKQMRVVLSDGTKVMVNAGTRLVYPSVFSENQREIYVEGEIYLDVYKDEQRPFIVRTPQMNVRVLGTSFNVSAYKEDEQASVVLVQGKVEVDVAGKGKNKLLPNEMLSVQRGKVSKSIVDVYKYICWTENIMLLDSDPLEQVVKRLSLYFGQEITCDQNIKHITISGKLNLRADISDVMRIITTVTHTPITAIHQNGNIVLKKKN